MGFGFAGIVGVDGVDGTLLFATTLEALLKRFGEREGEDCACASLVSMEEKYACAFPSTSPILARLEGLSIPRAFPIERKPSQL